MSQEQLILKKVKVHNLKGVDLTLAKNELIVFTGVSGSGKSSLAFDTIYVEGQRRYVDSLSTFARRQMGELIKPDLESITGISPTISIEQKTAGRNPRSTVGTLTGIYDYLRVLYARIGEPHCPVSGEAVKPQSKERIIKQIATLPEKTKITLFAPYAKEKKGEFKDDFAELLRKGYMRCRLDGKLLDLSDAISLDPSVNHTIDVVIDRLVVSAQNESRIADSVMQALMIGKGECSILNTDNGEEVSFSMHAYSPRSGLSYSSLEPSDFSFNSPSGMCQRCQGIGTTFEFDLSLIIDPNKSIAEDCCSIASSYQTVRYGNIYDNLAEQYHFSVHTPWKKLSQNAKDVFLNGVDKKWLKMQFIHPVTRASWVDHIRWRGVLFEARDRFSEAKSENYKKKMQELMHIQTCPECQGERLRSYPAATLLGGKRIAEITAMSVADCLRFFQEITLTPQEKLIAEELLKEIQERLYFLKEVGLHYLSLNRTAPTLSGGEAQRVRLASQIGCGLVGITYVLDEPSIGLHPRDNRKLIDTLKHLRDIGNTVIVVEHDEETIWEADHIVDFGTGAGSQGGEIIVDGSLQDLLKSKESVTGAYLSGRLEIPIPKQTRKKGKQEVKIIQATHHNLKKCDVSFPLNLFIAVTGVSGSGKSSLVTDILYPALSNLLHGGEHFVGSHKSLVGYDQIDKVIAIDQSPIGRNPRSNPATYIKLFDEIRDLFTKLPESQARGYKPGRFSFNVKEGSCLRCEGMGEIKIDMDFMEEAWAPCPVCKTKRFDSETLSIVYKEKNIFDVLEMSVDEAFEFFENIPSIKVKLEILKQVGMGYIKLGQSSTTLSGGEAQRIKLAKELVRPSTGKTFYILDEPTTGLHFHDINYLLKVLHKLVDNGNTVVVIEHNMDVVKTADWVIDLGPEGGEQGGYLVAAGPPKEIAKQDTPTGHAIKSALFPHTQEKVQAALKLAKPSDKKSHVQETISTIEVSSAEQNNLKHISVTIPREKITICTGPSGSGKSSFAFDTIYAEGQRRYVESLSPYARQFVKQMPKPKLGSISGLSPAIAIEQKAHAGNPRSTVGTMTEIYDFLRILYARMGIPHCPETGEVIQAISKEHIVDRILSYPKGETLIILSPIEIKKGENPQDVFHRLSRLGHNRIRLNGEFYTLEPEAIPLIPFDKKKKNLSFLVMDRIKTDPSLKSRLFEAVSHAAAFSGGKLVLLKGSEEVSLNLNFCVESTGKSYPEITPHSFAFNTPEGMCPECMGLGSGLSIPLGKPPLQENLSLIDCIKNIWGVKKSSPVISLFKTYCQVAKIDPFVPVSVLPKKQLQIFLEGGEEAPSLTLSSGLSLKWMGINKTLCKAGRNAHTDIKEAIAALLEEQSCPSCRGSRINPLSLAVTINDLSIHDLCSLPIRESLSFIEQLKFSPEELKLLGEVRNQLINRLKFLNTVGLHYLSLERKAPSLSGGEAQRIRLARQLGTGLTGVLYVLDEPTIGLHPKECATLNAALTHLKEIGNTLLVVEHDPLTIAHADYILDFGPGSGSRGGHITAQGTLSEILQHNESLTGAYLSNKKEIPLPSSRRISRRGALEIRGASANNLKGIDVDIPIGLMTFITGVSGSGKSTLLTEILLPATERRFQSEVVQIGTCRVLHADAFDKIIYIDQNPLGQTNRSDLCTFVEVLTPIREFFAKLPKAETLGLQPKHFSYNHRKGMCTACFGLGYRRIEMQFLPPVELCCEECQGQRLNPVSLEVTYKDKNLGQYLDMTVEEARVAFEVHPKITKILDTLISVGLGYVKLGQETATLSGGEAQRLKLSRELAKRSTGKTLYLLDEPTTGLHSDDIAKLFPILHKLVDKGNTMLIIEHQLDMIKNGDWVIELGPEAGDKGGFLVCAGTPEEVASNKQSATGPYLKKCLKNSAPKKGQKQKARKD